jgi:hypothetical protein
MTQYEVVSDYDEMSLRTDHNVDSTKLEAIQMSKTILLADSLWTAPADGTNVKAGDVWAHIISVNQVAKNGWVAIRHLGDIYCTYQESTSPATGSNAASNSIVDQSTTIGKFRLKRWDELNPSDSFSARERGGFDQFSFYTPYITDANGNWCGDWSSNNNFSILTSADMQKIAAMQIEDEHNLKAKMAWLTWAGEDSWGSPMRCKGEWNQVAQVKMIAAFYAGQMVEVLERRAIFCNFQGVKENVPMSRVRTFSRADFGKTFATHPHLIHKVTAVSTSNKYREKVKGTVYIPVALGPEFDFAGQFQPAHWWLMDRWIAYDSAS